VVAGERDEGAGGLMVTVESPPVPMGCRSCGVVAHSHGRRDVVLVDALCFGRPVRLVWRKRTWRCGEPACPVAVPTGQHDQLARPRALLTTRACWRAIRQLPREHASVSGIARQLGTTWRTVWRSIKPLLEAMADDETRFEGVGALGIDEHAWHHVSSKPVEDGGRCRWPARRVAGRPSNMVSSLALPEVNLDVEPPPRPWPAGLLCTMDGGDRRHVCASRTV
jgi:transposase